MNPALAGFFFVMIRKIEHIGVAVSDMEEAIKVYEDLFDKIFYKEEIVESEGVRTAFLQIGESKIELLEATNGDSPIAKFLEKQKGGFHHIAFDVEDIEAELRRLESKGFVLIHQSPKDGADNKRIAFLHPKSTLGMLLELCQEKIS